MLEDGTFTRRQGLDEIFGRLEHGLRDLGPFDLDFCAVALCMINDETDARLHERRHMHEARRTVRTVNPMMPQAS